MGLKILRTYEQKFESKKHMIDYIISCLMKYKEIDAPAKILIEEDLCEMRKIADHNKVLPILKEVVGNTDIQDGRWNDKSIVVKMYKSRLKMAKPIFEEFERAQIAYAILKGAYLAELAYGDMGLRSSNDIDILIDRKDIKKVKEICTKNGFVPGKSDRKNKCIIHYDRFREIAFSLNTHQIATMVKVGTNEWFDYYDTVLDCNFSLFWGGYEKNSDLTEVFLENTIKVCDGNGYNYFVLKPEYFLIQLCLHAYKEANGIFFVKSRGALCIRSFLDIYYYLIEQEKNLDWVCIKEVVEKYDLQRYLYYIMSVINELFEVRESVKYLIDITETEETKDSINEIGLDRRISCEEISLRDRFVKGAYDKWIDKNILKSELDRLKLTEEEFY